MQNDLLLRYFQNLRTQLFHAELQLQQTSPDDAAEWKAALEQVQQVLQACAACAANAAMHLYPLAETYEPAVVDTLRQHQRTIGAHHLALAIGTFPQASSKREQQVAAQKLKDGFDAIVLCQMQYLLCLQQNLLPVLYRYHNPELLQHVGALMTQNNSAPKETTVPQIKNNEALFRSMLYRAETELAAAQALALTGSTQPLAMHY